MDMHHRLQRLCRNLSVKLIRLNLFKTGSTEPAIIHRQVLSTRLFLILFGIAIFILLAYTSISKQTVTETLQQPSLAIFDILEKEYSNTLYCPCSQISIQYARFVEAKPSFHQVCSSDFVSQAWIDWAFGANLTILWPFDVRTSLSAMWQIVASLCQNAAYAITDTLNEFANDPLISYTAFSKTYLEATIQAALEDARQTAISRFAKDLTAIQTVTQVNAFMTGLKTNFLGSSSGDPSLDVVLWGMGYEVPGSNNTCYCQINQSCPMPAALYPTDVITVAEYNLNQSISYVIIPGIIVDCLPSLATFRSSLECFYNQSCIDILFTGYSRAINISILNGTITSRFPPTTILKQIIDQIFVENILNATSFTAYYEECAPMSCSYTYSRRFAWIFVITTLVGLVGGLNAALRLLTPNLIVVLMILKRRLLRQTTQVQVNNDISMRFKLRNMLVNAKRKLIDFNVFSNDRTQDQFDVHQGRIASRIYVVLITLAMLVLILYTARSVQIFTVTIQSPTQEQYEELQERYPSTLQCPCTVISIPYEEFIQIIPTYHQVCSSDFIQPWWYQWLYDPLLGLDTVDFFMVSSSYFQTLAFLCDMAKQTFALAYNQFSLTDFVNAEILSRPTFTTQTNALLRTFLETTRAEFIFTIQLVDDIFRADQYVSGLGTNTVFKMQNSGEMSMSTPDLVYSTFKEYNLNTENMCDCGKNPNCTRHNDTNRVVYIPEGVSIRCLILDTTLQSSLACWYNDECLDYFLTIFVIYANQPPNNISVLNSTQSSRFPPNTILETILNEIMVEYFNSSATYNLYYQKCRPASCTYTYKERSNLVYIFTTIIGLFGGLNVILRLLSPLMAKVFLKRSKAVQTNVPLTVSTQSAINDRKSKIHFQLSNHK